MEKNQVLRKLPKVGDLLDETPIKDLMEKYGKWAVVNAVRRSIDEIRRSLEESLERGFVDVVEEEGMKKIAVERALRLVDEYRSYNLKKVINATGVVLHTNLGRAPLPEEALKNILDVASGYSNLEYDLMEGSRGERYAHIRELLCEITGAEDTMVVNNNAGAVLLTLSALAAGREVIISRGQLVEIGGSFRVPDVMAQSGARLVEVGTTNKTHVEDYERAINENTALLLKVHTSNFRFVGFWSEVAIEQLKALGLKYGIPVMEDLGSGVLVDVRKFGLPPEPTVQESIRAGADIVTFSGDKLLGGPQAGIIVGRKELLERIKRHPLTRALRIDKLTLSALEAVLKLYRSESLDRIPVIKMLSKSQEDMEKDARQLAAELQKVVRERGTVEIIDDVSQVGGGSLPGAELPTKAVALSLRETGPEELAERLRKARIPVIGRIKKDRFLLDVRTMSEEDLKTAVEMVGSVL
ncbi:L-seryl-tRNA(Sec) selenium transferase [Thermosediminibacter oceani]|uniref:L-seryl-tRNA(Sec) selenium transferase n=1 Tax=Thermosediminibacter oceani (strain ATCC BAA-1034 / DSM 16646 / JW/IW-1228P) TaxID=555079 RepID=D9S2B3_THEOJ|nr:L-seryl-tRNA(Sec) selenium transferase [Thermosediminibacter oceani]ADL07540.1 L-seryl-tRNA selenium transferase [Thermosediminibacter oceani DSM 16646]